MKVHLQLQLQYFVSGMVKNLPTKVVIVITSRISGRGYRNGAVCVCVCVCLFVSALTAEPLNIWSRNLVQGLTLIISRTSLLVKVIGQRSRSRGQKTSFSGFSDLSEQISSLGLWCDVMTSHDVMGSRRDVIWRHCMTSWRHMTSLHDVMTSHAATL